jgi:hypothetical protein
MTSILSVNVCTYTVAVTGDDQIKKADHAIEIYLRKHPAASMDDALDALFDLGVNAFICKAFPPHNSTANEVCLNRALLIPRRPLRNTPGLLARIGRMARRLVHFVGNYLHYRKQGICHSIAWATARNTL